MSTHNSPRPARQSLFVLFVIALLAMLATPALAQNFPIPQLAVDLPAGGASTRVQTVGPGGAALSLTTLSRAGMVAASRPHAPFTPGNLVIYRVGDGAGILTGVATAVFLDEYTTAGALVQSIPMPTVVSGANRRLVASGTATSEGFLTLSTDGSYLVLSGYDADVGTVGISGTASATVNRVVGRVDAAGAVDTTTALSDAFSASNFRSVASTNGNDFWLSGNGSTGASAGSRHTTLGSTSSTQVSATVTNLRNTYIYQGQLYISTGSGSAVRVGAVGAGTPTGAGQTITNLTGFPTTGSPYGFFLADLDANTPGVDTLYVTDDTANVIQKYSLVGPSWTLNGTITASTVRGLTGSVAGATVTLYATTGGSAGAGGGSLYSYSDATGYNGTPSGAVTTIATAATNTAFRGVAFAPSLPPATPTPTPTNTPAPPTATPTDTPTNTPTATPTPTDTPTNTPTATPTNTPTATPTATDTPAPPTATPTATPTPGSPTGVQLSSLDSGSAAPAPINAWLFAALALATLTGAAAILRRRSAR